MKKWNRKQKSIFISCFVVSIFLLLAMPAWAADNSAADPLVSKSWVDQYIDSEFKALQSDLSQLRTDINTYKEQQSRHIVLYLGRQDAFINDKITVLDVMPAVKNNFIMVPLRFIGEALQLSVNWDGITKTATCKAGATTVILPLNGSTATVNGKTVTLSCSPMAVDGRILVPTRFISEAFGCRVNWDNNLKKVDIYR
jgi:hypothetical protein